MQGLIGPCLQLQTDKGLLSLVLQSTDSQSLAQDTS